jgi:type IV secretion system protein TrbL
MRTQRKRSKPISVLLCIGLAVFSVQAFAAIDNAGILDNVLARYSTAAGAWQQIITTRASWLFWTLTVISMIWTFGMMALRRGDLGEFFAEFARFTIFTGFFWWLLVNGPQFATSLIMSLRQMGAEATNLPGTLAPSGIVDIGFDIFFKILDQSSVWAPVDSGCGIIIGAVIMVVFALVGVNMLLLLISSWILAYAGIFFLGFGGSRWTSEMAIGYFRTVLNIAAQLFTMVLLVGIGKSFVDQYYTSMSAGISFKELGVMLVVAAVMLALVRTIPGLIGGLAGGNAASLGSGFGAGAALGAAALGAAAIGTAGAAVVAGATSMAGGAQALMAAFSHANAAASAGGGATASLVNAAGSTAGEDGGGGAEAGGTLSSAMGETGAGEGIGTSPASGEAASDDLPGSQGEYSIAGEHSAPGEVKTGRAMASAAATAGKVARVTAGASMNLARGALDVAKAKGSSIKDAAMDRIGDSTGGKIAAAIKARAGAAADGRSAEFDGDSLSVGTDTADAQAEVAAFRDRGGKTS